MFISTRSSRTHGWFWAVGLSVVALCGVTAAPASAKPSQYLQADELWVRHYVSVEAPLLGVDPVPITVKEGGLITKGDAETYMYDAQGQGRGPETHCLIRFSANAHRGRLAKIQADAAHEVFHCLSGELSPTLAIFNSHGKWLIEGAAAWVDTDLVPGDPYARGWWEDYLTAPGVSLFSRDYGAAGFFGHLAQSGIDPWTVFRAMFSAPGDVAAYDASGADNGSALDTEASAFFGAPELGDAWTAWHQGNATADDNVPRTHQVEPTVVVKDGATKTLTVKPYADGDYRLDPETPITSIDVGGIGYARLHSTEGPDVDVSHVTDLTLCKEGRPCRCPGGNRPPGAVSFEVGDLAITGGPNGATVMITANCGIPAEPCTDLNLSADFPTPAGGLGSPQTTDTGVNVALPGLRSGSGCTVQAYAIPLYQPPSCPDPPQGTNCLVQPLGSYDLLNFDSDQGAKKAFATVVSDALFDSTPTPADVGDQAAVSNVGGVVQIENEIFFFRWLPVAPADSGIDPGSVLSQVVDMLCPNCTG